MSRIVGWAGWLVGARAIKALRGHLANPHVSPVSSAVLPGPTEF